MAYFTPILLYGSEWRFEAEKAAKDGQETMHSSYESHQSGLMCSLMGSVGSVDGQRSFKASLSSRSGIFNPDCAVWVRMAFRSRKSCKRWKRNDADLI